MNSEMWGKAEGSGCSHMYDGRTSGLELTWEVRCAGRQRGAGAVISMMAGLQDLGSDEQWDVQGGGGGASAGHPGL